MRIAREYFNAHSNANRADGCKMGYMAPEKISKKDENAYSLAMEKNANARRKVKVSLPEMPW